MFIDVSDERSAAIFMAHDTLNTCSLLDVNRHFGGTNTSVFRVHGTYPEEMQYCRCLQTFRTCLHFQSRGYLDDGDITFLRNAGTNLPDYTTPHSRRQERALISPPKGSSDCKNAREKRSTFYCYSRNCLKRVGQNKAPSVSGWEATRPKWHAISSLFRWLTSLTYLFKWDQRSQGNARRGLLLVHRLFFPKLEIMEFSCLSLQSPVVSNMTYINRILETGVSSDNW
jgi:hypothetical protein